MRVTFFYLSTMRKKSSRHLILGGLVDRLDGFLETRPADELAVLLQREPHDGTLPSPCGRPETDIWNGNSLVIFACGAARRRPTSPHCIIIVIAKVQKV